jgi:hypothetical protein
MTRESTIELMKSSQKQTTQFAFEHSKQSVEFVKSELRQEQLAHHLNIIENYKSQLFFNNSEIIDKEKVSWII